MKAAHPANHLQLPGVCLLWRLWLCLPFPFPLLSSGARCTDRTLGLFLDRGGRPVDDGASRLHEGKSWVSTAAAPRCPDIICQLNIIDLIMLHSEHFNVTFSKKSFLCQSKHAGPSVEDLIP